MPHTNLLHHQLEGQDNKSILNPKVRTNKIKTENKAPQAAVEGHGIVDIPLEDTS
jgi:hypothetical protein